mmetsp:Transcript_14858/g.44896  ORF Transcript_14858/g.44896 Transcript_14858/m.44896 type:complete len:280 (-) Transcript_14858:788-1627(-)|eukprot:CAMPEP_0206141032 /NCGR_PEP_ID=MMETSP1473-20131121/11576_1 /ASSEMBLY_ACC=CAM_ASM_001109 /TAXON_ID=1461547 /ORGANISM="Stichococcus sp, Strain RCC1054" /LENGTH=279 /DNA_ID=CAMNT_0053535429 /DNA_START=189 /DNA_END=1028 /DNA_ORIENTATION=+
MRDSADVVIRPTVYELHAEKLRERHWGSCGSLASLSAVGSAAGDDPAGCSPSSSFSSVRETPPSLQFRYPGSKAGSHPHKPWHHSALRDAYERINVWSHGVPGILFLIAAVVAPRWAGEAVKPMALFCAAAAATHLLSALGHVFPDDHYLEKADHLGIVALIISNPLSSLVAIEHGHVPQPMIWMGALLVGGAFFPPAPRVAAFTVGTIAIVTMFGREIYTFNLGIQLALYGVAAVAFLRNAGHHRCIGLSDHHVLHYVVTAACLLQLANISDLVARNS